MAPKDENNLYETLTGGTDVPPAAEEFSLEEILAEYGGSLEQHLLQDAEQRTPGSKAKQTPPKPPEVRTPQKAPAPKKDAAPDPALEAERLRQEARDKLLAQAVDLEKLERELPRAPRPISLEEVVGSTVEAVIEEREAEPLLRPRRKRSDRSWSLSRRRRTTGRSTRAGRAHCPWRRFSPWCRRPCWRWNGTAWRSPIGRGT